MYTNVPAEMPDAIFAAATSCQQRQLLAEPLWFAVMCRELFGANAAKELRFLLDKSERTCRAWASGDSEPPAGVLAALILSDHSHLVVNYLTRHACAEPARDLGIAVDLCAKYRIEPR